MWCLCCEARSWSLRGKMKGAVKIFCECNLLTVKQFDLFLKSLVKKFDKKT